MNEFKQQDYLPRDRRELQKKFVALPNETARKDRRTLLLLSVLAFLVGSSNDGLREFSGGGVSLKIDHPQAIYWLLALILAYFMVVFWLYSSDDFHEARKLWSSEDRSTMGVGSTRLRVRIWLRARIWARNGTYLLWFSLEFVVPYVAALGGISLMVYRIAW